MRKELLKELQQRMSKTEPSTNCSGCNDHELKMRKELLKELQQRMSKTEPSTNCSGCNDGAFQLQRCMEGYSEKRPLQTSNKAVCSLNAQTSIQLEKVLKNETGSSSSVGSLERSHNHCSVSGRLEEEEELFELEAEIQALQHSLPALEQLQEKAMRSALHRFAAIRPSSWRCPITSVVPDTPVVGLRPVEHTQHQLHERQHKLKGSATSSRAYSKGYVAPDANTRERGERHKPQKQLGLLSSLAVPSASCERENPKVHEGIVARRRGRRGKQLNMAARCQTHPGRTKRNLSCSKWKEGERESRTTATSKTRRDDSDYVIYQTVHDSGLVAALALSMKGKSPSFAEQSYVSPGPAARAGYSHAGLCDAGAKISGNKVARYRYSPGALGISGADSGSRRRRDGKQKPKSINSLSTCRGVPHQRLRDHLTQTCLISNKLQQHNVLMDEMISIIPSKKLAFSAQRQHVSQKRTSRKYSPVVPVSREAKTAHHQSQKQAFTYQYLQVKKWKGLKKRQQQRQEQAPRQRMHLHFRKYGDAYFPDPSRICETTATGKDSPESASKAILELSQQAALLSRAVSTEAIPRGKDGVFRPWRLPPEVLQDCRIMANNLCGSGAHVLAFRSSQQQSVWQHEDKRHRRVAGTLDPRQQQECEREQVQAKRKQQTEEHRILRTAEQVQIHEQLHMAEIPQQPQKHEGCENAYACMPSAFDACSSSPSLFLRSSSSSSGSSFQDDVA